MRGLELPALLVSLSVLAILWLSAAKFLVSAESDASNQVKDTSLGDLDTFQPELVHQSQLDNFKTESSESDRAEDVGFDQLYEQGVQAYDDHLWYSCATKLERAIRDHRFYKQSLSDCRLGCARGGRLTFPMSNFSSNLTDFATFAKFLKDADCFRRCVDQSLSIYPKLTERLEHAFESRVPYQYLQFCYYKLDRLSQAASAAYTHFLANPGDPDTRQNIVFYRDKAKVAESDFVDLELLPYREHYMRAMLAYGGQQWGSAVFHLEACLDQYFKEHERCLVDCEGRFRVKGSDFKAGVADVMVDILTCKLSCEAKLSVVYTEPVPFFLQDILHHLQFSYYKEGDLEKSAEATASFLLLNSSHEVMNENKRLLQVKLSYADDDFIPRKDVAQHTVMRKEIEDFKKIVHSLPQAEVDVSNEDLSEVIDRMERREKTADDWMARYQQLGMHIVARAKDLHRAERFVSDGLLRQEQCEDILALTKDLPLEPTGSQIFDLKVARQRLEHDSDEEFETSLRLFVRAAEVIRHYTQRYQFPGLSLFLKHTSIVCWGEQPGSAECYYQEDGSCVRFEDMSDELYSDAYTTVTYLNTADEDADFLFLSEQNQVDSSFGVKCGRTVGFNTGDRHTLKVPGQKQPRCALVMRYSKNHISDERDYRETLMLLQRIDELRMASAAPSSQSLTSWLEEEGVEITQTSQELLGELRFVADQVATPAQCLTLRNVVQSGALLGDGYDHLSSKPSLISPHTQHEMYQGITIYRAAKLAEQKLVSLAGLKAFLDLSDKCRLLVAKYFNLTKPLYFDYTHLVCRTAIADDNQEREDLSHPVHADNCLIQADGSCRKDYPAFTQRDYSAILYLNDGFEGGEFFFANSDQTEQVSVTPKPGRLVGFSAGDFHGVKAVKRGQRCALALWFTHNANFKELAHIQARKTLKRLEEREIIELKPVHEDL